MDMNNLRTESHIAQKLRRHKLRFQQNSDDPTRQHLLHEPPPPRFEFELYRPGYGSIPHDPNLFSSEMLHGFIDQDSCNSNNPQTVPFSNDWNVVSMNIDHGYNQDLQNLSDQKNSGDGGGDGGGGLPAFGCNPYYQNSLQEIVTSATGGTILNNSDELGFVSNRRKNENSRLSLSLSSVPSVSQGKTEFPGLLSGSKPLKMETLTNSDPKRLMGMGSFGHRSVGPLGPFTGYATILKNSKYLEPAQELLSDSCDVGGRDELVRTCDNACKILEEEMSRVSGESGASPSSCYGSSEHFTGRSSSLSEAYRPEFHHKKAKLLYMQEEVCRRDKQYHQQMQMVISSFETVAGLTSSTPYISLALKSVSRHFRVVKNAISEQLIQMKKTFEDLCSPSRTFNANDSLRSMDHSFQRHEKSSGGPGFFGNQQPVWRPQRGLPERAVSVLKAWLFDHFLHPYPSDADKHMLATQTGLTRNQVSNWFINARVRIWKPMVEEIHTLETKGLAGSTPTNPLADGQDTSRVATGLSPNKQQQPECSRTSETLAMIHGQNEPNDQLLDHEKRSRPDYQVPQHTTMDRSFADVVPYPRTTFETGGVGPVSLTLGLRQNAEHVQQLQQHEHQFRQQFGGQLIHDFVG